MTTRSTSVQYPTVQLIFWFRISQDTAPTTNTFKVLGWRISFWGFWCFVNIWSLAPPSPPHRSQPGNMLTIRERSDGFCIWIENNPHYETMTRLSTSLILQSRLLLGSTGKIFVFLCYFFFRKCYYCWPHWFRCILGFVRSLLGRIVIVASLF